MASCSAAAQEMSNASRFLNRRRGRNGGLFDRCNRGVSPDTRHSITAITSGSYSSITRVSYRYQSESDLPLLRGNDGHKLIGIR